MLERWTRAVLRRRAAVLAAWLAVLGLGAFSATGLSSLLTNDYTVAGTDSQRAASILSRVYGERPDGTFTVIFEVPDASGRLLRTRLHRRLVAASRVVPTGRAGRLLPGPGVLYGDIATRLDLKHAKRYTDDVRAALLAPGGPSALVTGQPAIQRDLDPVLASDLRRGEAIAIPIALVVLLLAFGISWVVGVPILFAASTIAGTLLAVYGLAHVLPMVTWVTNLVELIGLGLAIDYSLLIVYRFREELDRHDTTEEAVVRTMATAGRAVVVSGVAVATGLALLLFVPVPFVRAMGVGGLLIPLVSIAAALTLQPALLSVLGRRGVRRVPIAQLLPDRLRRAPSQRKPVAGASGFWPRLAAWVMRRPLPVFAGGAAVLVAASVPAFSLKLTPGSLSGIPSSLESVQGFDLLHDRVGAGSATPTQVVLDSGARGRARSRAVRLARTRLADELFHDPEVLLVATGPRKPYLDASGRYARVIAVGRHEYGDEPTRQFVGRLRRSLVPAAGLPPGTRAYAGGAPPQGVDFLSSSYGVFPWLVAGVLLLTYLVLVRAFRSLVLPLEAVLLNLLTVAAVYGLLVLAFQWGVAADALGLYRTDQIDGWVPIFLFATLFGLSMDYEVFLVLRIRESWDSCHDNALAVERGLERTGRVITAAALIMAAAFSGFVAGRVAALQQLGLGLALAVLLDATIVRSLLAPALMALVGRYNWWLPASAARLVRVPPSPIVPGEGRSSPSPGTIST